MKLTFNVKIRLEAKRYGVAEHNIKIVETIDPTVKAKTTLPTLKLLNIKLSKPLMKFGLQILI